MRYPVVVFVITGAVAGTAVVARANRALPVVSGLSRVGIQMPGKELPDSPAPQPGVGSPDSEGIYKVGGDVRAPVLVFQVDPEFTEAAREKKISGDVTISLIVDAGGIPQSVRVVRGLGLGLDEKAVEAVRQYRFKPAMKGATPVPVKLMVQVNFHIF